jgi:hypothetical protein
MAPSVFAVNASGNALVVGSTHSTNLPAATGAYQTVNQAVQDTTNAFGTEFEPTDKKLVYSAYLGGAGIEPCGPWC